MSKGRTVLHRLLRHKMVDKRKELPLECPSCKEVSLKKTGDTINTDTGKLYVYACTECHAEVTF